MEKKIKTTALLLFIAASFCGRAVAQTPFHLINVSGTLYSFILEEKPRFWHSDGLLHIHTESSKINFVMSKVSHIFWDCDVPTSIGQTIENRITFAINDNRLTISGNPDAAIRIYSLKGILCAEVQPNGNEIVNVDISDLEQGTYIVKISDFTFKFLKR